MRHSHPRKPRLTKSWQYQHVYRHGHRLRFPTFTLIYASNAVGLNRVGLSVSGIKLAVRRNRIKRLLREFCRHHPSFPLDVSGTKEKQSNFDLVIATNKQFSVNRLTDIESIFLPLCQKV